MVRSGWTGWTARTETRGYLGLQERRETLDGGVTKDLQEIKEREEMWASEVTRVTQDWTASRKDPKERPATLAPWVSLGEMACQEVPENLERAVALAEGDPQELRATGAVLARLASRESRAPEEHRAPLASSVLQV